jgi:hypothetical protein
VLVRWKVESLGDGKQVDPSIPSEECMKLTVFSEFIEK